jgi:hypothetical protein
MTTGLLGDTSFLDTLQQASQVLNDRVSSSPFGNYTPSQASDYVVGPLGGIAQNKFMGDQFQTPNPFNAPYIPEAFNAASVLNAASTSPFNYNFGSYTPGAFNQFYGSPMASPAIARTTTRTGGGGRDGDRNVPGQIGGVTTQMVGDKMFRFNDDGTFTEVDPTSVDYKVNSFISGLLNLSPMQQLAGFLGKDDVTTAYNAVKNRYGEEVANKFAMETDLGRMARDQGLLSPKLRESFARAENQARSDIGVEAKAYNDAMLAAGYAGKSRDQAAQEARDARSRAAGLNVGRERGKDAAAAATGKSRGYFGGR